MHAKKNGFWGKMEKVDFGVSSAWISVMVNGSPKGFFPAGKGLRQGEPLSSFLFLIVD